MQLWVELLECAVRLDMIQDVAKHMVHLGLIRSNISRYSGGYFIFSTRRSTVTILANLARSEVFDRKFNPGLSTGCVLTWILQLHHNSPHLINQINGIPTADVTIASTKTEKAVRVRGFSSGLAWREGP